MTKRALVVITALAMMVYGGWWLNRQYSRAEPIKVGILHSITGHMASSESRLADATLMAVEEINKAGGVLGRRLEPVIGDGASDWPTFAKEARRLIKNEGVSVIFGGYTSASRKNIKPVVEELESLLFYPVPYEGAEKSPNIVYNGSSPNQLYVPAVKWCTDNLGKRFFLVGSDYIWPRTVHVLMKDLITALGGTILGEEYVLLGSTEVKNLVARIEEAKPDVILSTIVGPTNNAFFAQMHSQGITPKQMPVMAFGITELELSTMDVSQVAGNYSCWSYFQSVDRPINEAFVQRLKDRYGQDKVVSDPMEAGYFGVYLYAQAVRDAGSTDTNLVRTALADQSFEAPGGLVFIDGGNMHTWKFTRIGRILPSGQFEIVWTSGKPVRPLPYPIYRTREAWNKIVESLYLGWGKRWANPGE